MFELVKDWNRLSKATKHETLPHTHPLEISAEERDALCDDDRIFMKLLDGSKQEDEFKDLETLQPPHNQERIDAAEARAERRRELLLG